MLLSIIIVSYNTRQLTVAAIDSVLNELQRSSLFKDQTELIVVDNNSSDDSVAAFKVLSKKNPQLQVIANQTNRGFAQANNQGLELATGEFLFLLNSDTLVQPGALKSLVTRFQAQTPNDVTAYTASHHGQLDRLGLLAATLLNPDGTLQPQGGAFPNLISLGCHLWMLDDLPLIGRWLPSTQHTGHNLHQTLDEVSDSKCSPLLLQAWVGGTALMIRRQVLDEIGLLDEQIFMYGEDVEFCLRAQNHHWDVAIDPQARILHYGSASSSSVRAIEGELKGYLYIWSKHKPLWQLPIARFMIRSGCRLRQWLFGTILRNQTRAQIYTTVLTTL